MNSVSWFVYSADVVGNFQVLLFIGSIIALIGSGICLLAWSIEDFESGPKFAKRIIFGAVPALIVACLIPGTSTMYAIAASQIGERIATSEQVQGIANDATKALQIWIKKQIEPESKK